MTAEELQIMADFLTELNLALLAGVIIWEPFSVEIDNLTSVTVRYNEDNDAYEVVNEE